eukprot:scaffold253474_cov21-Tisochrysis_lutea.AAC.1
MLSAIRSTRIASQLVARQGRLPGGAALLNRHIVAAAPRLPVSRSDASAASAWCLCVCVVAVLRLCAAVLGSGTDGDIITSRRAVERLAPTLRFTIAGVTFEDRQVCVQGERAPAGSSRDTTSNLPKTLTNAAFCVPKPRCISSTGQWCCIHLLWLFVPLSKNANRRRTVAQLSLPPPLLYNGCMLSLISSSYLLNICSEGCPRLARLCRCHMHVVSAAAAIHAHKKVSELVKGQALMLLHDPSNVYDKNAVAVRTMDGGDLGFVPRDYNAQLLDQGISFAKVLSVGQNEAEKWGAVIGYCRQ